MAIPTPVNGQITDEVTQTNLTVLGSAPALARQALVQAVTMALQNAVAAQQRNYLLRQAATTALVRQALAASPEEALKIVEPHLAGDDIAETLKQLWALFSEIEGKSNGGEPGKT